VDGEDQGMAQVVQQYEEKLKKQKERIQTDELMVRSNNQLLAYERMKEDESRQKQHVRLEEYREGEGEEEEGTMQRLNSEGKP